MKITKNAVLQCELDYWRTLMLAEDDARREQNRELVTKLVASAQEDPTFT